MFVSTAATILHADVDSFFASVAQRDQPELRGKPVLVGGGVVLAASYEAKAHGVKGGMAGSRARRMCPRAIVVRPDFSSYTEASRELFKVFRDTAPLVEGIGMEEAFLDVRGLRRISGSPRAIAATLRRRVRAEVGLPISVGVARTKVLAKMGSQAAKPDGLLVIEPERELEFLRPLPIERIWGVGPTSARKLHAHGIRTVADAQRIPETLLMQILGAAGGRHVHAIVHNRDRRRVRTDSRRRSFGAQAALGRGPHSPSKVEIALTALVERVTRRMRKADRAGRTITLRLRFADYTRATRSATLAQPSAATAPILGAAHALLRAARPLIARRGITLVGIAISNLTERGAGSQLALALPPRGGSELDAAIDELRDRYGAAALSRASLLGKDPRHEAWLTPGDA